MSELFTPEEVKKYLTPSPFPGREGEQKLAMTALYWMQQAEQYRDEALGWHAAVLRMLDEQAQQKGG